MTKIFYWKGYEISLTPRKFGYVVYVYDTALDADLLKDIIPPMKFEDAVERVKEMITSHRTEGGMYYNGRMDDVE